jgi:hypothetical protein
MERVRKAHALMQRNTEMAYQALCEITNTKQQQQQHQQQQQRNKVSLRTHLRRIINVYGPVLRLNDRIVSCGGTFLVQICRARYGTEIQILHCVKELVENYAVHVDVLSHESPSSYLSPLCVAAARGMNTIVKVRRFFHSFCFKKYDSCD